jgi:hypothetical protein
MERRKNSCENFSLFQVRLPTCSFPKAPSGHNPGGPQAIFVPDLTDQSNLGFLAFILMLRNAKLLTGVKKDSATNLALAFN